jgi:hypothetical protein
MIAVPCIIRLREDRVYQRWQLARAAYISKEPMYRYWSRHSIGSALSMNVDMVVVMLKLRYFFG